MSANSTVTAHAIIEFNAAVHVKMQQRQARTQPYVKMMEMKGKAMAYDGLGTVELGDLDGRYQAVEFSDMEHWRRKITKARFGMALPIDAEDVNERLVDPESGYAEALAFAAKRKFDKVVVAAMFADVKTGEDFETTVTAASDGVLTVDATAGLTYEKLLEIHQNFIDNEVGNDMDTSFVMGITGDEHTDLMSELELTSGDYSREYIAENGKMQQAVGIKILKFAASGAGGASPVLPVVSGVRTSFCMAEGAIAVAIASNWDIRVEERPDLYNTRQVKITGTLGAVRTEGKLIQKITTTD